MSEPTVEVIRASIAKDGTDRLQAELLECFPTSLSSDVVKSWSRAELIDKVTQCRVYLKQTGRCQTVLEGRVVITGAVGGAARIEGVNPTTSDPMAMFLQWVQIQTAKDERDRQERREREKREKEERELDFQRSIQILELRMTAEQAERDKAERENQLRLQETLKTDREEYQRQFAELLEQGRQRDATNAELRSQSDDKKDVRIKRASDVLRGTVGQMPINPLELPVWLYHLERQFKMNAIGDDIRLPLLNQLLNDNARRLIARLSDEVSSDYNELVDALLREYQLTPAKYLEHFKSISKETDETYTTLATRIEIALKYYLKVEISKSRTKIVN
jgi:hypothetical protein